MIELAQWLSGFFMGALLMQLFWLHKMRIYYKKLVDSLSKGELETFKLPVKRGYTNKRPTGKKE